MISQTTRSSFSHIKEGTKVASKEARIFPRRTEFPIGLWPLSSHKCKSKYPKTQPSSQPNQEHTHRYKKLKPKIREVTGWERELGALALTPVESRSRSARERLFVGKDRGEPGLMRAAGGASTEGGIRLGVATRPTRGSRSERGGSYRTGIEAGATTMAESGGGRVKARAGGGSDKFPTAGRDVARGGDWPGASKPHSHL